MFDVIIKGTVCCNPLGIRSEDVVIFNTFVKFKSVLSRRHVVNLMLKIKAIMFTLAKFW